MKALFIGLIFLLGCASGLRVKPAKFSYNDRMRNGLIVDRIPQYGDTKRDGCVVERQIYLSVKTTVNFQHTGKVQDVETAEPLAGAVIRVHQQNVKQPLSITANSNGEFSFDSKDIIQKLDVSFIGWRTLYIDFKTKQSNNKG